MSSAGEPLESASLRNRLLEALPQACTERLLSASTFITLPVGTPLFTRDTRPRFYYFLQSGIASVVFTSKNGTSIELSTQGNEGLIGWDTLFGPALKPTDCNIQVAGAGYRVPAAAMQREFDQSPETRQRVLEYAQHQHLGANQLAACNRLHRAEARFARWVLMVADRIGSGDLAMTQEFMAMMLGARRTTLAEVCSNLGKAGALEGRRGGIHITNRKLLQSRACECYRILRALYDDLYAEPLRMAGAAGEPSSQGNGRS